MTTAATRYTYDDLLRMPEDDGYHYEIIDGELFVNPAAIPRHQTIVLRLAVILSNYVDETKSGIIFIAPTDIVFAYDNVLQPDIFFISNERMAILNEKNVGGAPDLAIEVLSVSTRRKDKVRKRDVYERFGVTEYWILDPRDSSATLYRREGQRFGKPEVTTTAVTSPLLPGLRVSLARVFAF
jgi:Uma2 family endonuclease